MALIVEELRAAGAASLSVLAMRLNEIRRGGTEGDGLRRRLGDCCRVVGEKGTCDARAILTTLRLTQANHVQVRDRILEEVAEQSLFGGWPVR